MTQTRFLPALPVCLLIAALTPAAAPSRAGAALLSQSIVTDAEHVRVHPGPTGAVVSAADPSFTMLGDPGAPQLPYRVVAVLLPEGEDIGSYRVTESSPRVIARGVSVALAGAIATEDGQTGAGPATAPIAPGAFPAEGARLLGVGTLHGYTIASFAVFPVRLKDGTLTVSENLTLEIETVTSSRPAPVTLQRLRPEVRARARAELASVVVNPADADAYAFNEVAVPRPRGGFSPTSFPSLEGSAVDYVIVTPDALASAYQALADFKTRKGVPTVVRTVEWILAHYQNGSDPQETIRNFVKDAYAKWGITYALLGGDTDQVPARFGTSSFYSGLHQLPADMYFGCLDGDWNANHDARFGEAAPIDNPDLYAEVYVGRLPTSSVAEVNMLVGKIIAYETPTDMTFGQRVLMLGEVLFPFDWTPPNPITLNGADLAEIVYTNSLVPVAGLNVTRMYETEELYPGSVDENRAAVITQLNAGYDHVIHVGHGFRFNMSVGDASIVNSDADVLTNGNRLSCIYFVNCTGAAYTYSCLAEHYLRNPNGGAVCVIGANDSAFPYAMSNYMNEYYDLLFGQNVCHVGETFARSRLPRTPLAVLGDNVDLWTHYIYTLLADPEMPMWNGPVSTLSAAYPASVSKGTNSIVVTVTSGGNPVDSAVVCLSKGDEDYVVGTTDATGQVTLKFRAETTGNIDVVVTGRNYKRYEGTISVGGTGAYVALSSMTVDDDNVGGTSGNGNGVIEGGETVDLGLTLRNTGTASTGTVTLTLRSNDGGVTLDDSTASAGVIGTGGTALATGGVRVVFSSTLADEHAVPFTLVLKEDGVETWGDAFKKLVHQPVLDLVKLRVDDTVTGNGNGVVEAGEQFKLFYKVKNFGTGTYPGGNATVYDLDAGFTLITPTAAYGTMAPVAAVENTTGFVLIEPSVAVEHRLRVSIVDLYGRAYEDTVELRAPSAPSALVIDPSLGPDRLQVTWMASPSLDVAHYNMYRSQNALGPFTLANIDPVAHTMFTDTGLAPNTLYYYRAAAIDASGNESGLSSTGSGSTNPQQVSGWPLAVKTETNSSPAVGDVDGDGTNEIVVCSDRVYVWHANGSELVNGDGDAQTWGVLSSLGSSFVSHPALARLDHTFGLEIVAASRDTKQVFVFNRQGNVVTGWPRPVENTLRAGMVAGDMDGDGLFEVVAVDEKGVVYVWKADGTELIDGDANPLTQGVFYRMTGCTFNYSTPAMADIDGDGKDELIVGSQGSRVYVFNENGSLSAGWPYVLGSSISGSPAVGDVDNNGDLEIVVFEAVGNLRVLNHDGTQLMLGFFNNSGAQFFGPSPAIGNVTGDAKLEIFVPTANGKIYGVNSVGIPLAGWPVTYSTTYTESSPILADLDGDGVPEIILGDETKLIHAYNVSGQLVAGFPLGTGDAMRGVPTAADMDQDGDVDLVAAGWDKNVYVWDFAGTWNPANSPWPRFHANVHNNGKLGFVVPTPVGGAMFSYSIRGSGMELAWVVPLEVGTVFAVERAEVVNGRAGSYTTIARSVGIGVDGVVRVVDRGVEEGSRYAYRLEGDGGTVHETAGLYVPVTRAVLGQNYPNPFNPVTRIEYWVPGEGGGKTAVSVVVYDVRGARVRTLVNEGQVAGRYSVEWDGRDDRGVPVGSGVYFYRMSSGGFADVRKMVLLK